MSILKQNELSTNDRTAMIRQAFWLEYATLAWMTVEAAVAIASGIAANSLTLVAFGIDSIIELASAGVLVWRLTVELRQGRVFVESAEQRAARIGGSCCSHSRFSSLSARVGGFGHSRPRSSRYLGSL